MPTVDLRAQREDRVSELFFPVVIHPLTAMDANAPITTGDAAAGVVPIYNGNGRQFIARTDTNMVLGVHGSVYKLVRNSEAFPLVDQAITNSDQFSSSAMDTRDIMCDGGLRSFREYRFRHHMYAMQAADTPSDVGLLIRVINSYDGTQPFGFVASGYLQQDPSVIYSFLNTRRVETFGKHTTNLNPRAIAAQLTPVLATFTDYHAIWQVWHTTLLGAQFDVQGYIEGNATSLQQATAILDYWNSAMNRYGVTAFAIYHMLSQWASTGHVRTRYENNRPAIQLQREREVTRLMNLVLRQLT